MIVLKFNIRLPCAKAVAAQSEEALARLHPSCRYGFGAAARPPDQSAAEPDDAPSTPDLGRVAVAVRIGGR